MEAAKACPGLPTAARWTSLRYRTSFRRERRATGQGQYDQLLTASGGFTCGVGFDEQLVPEVPVEPTMNLNAVVLTPAQACECRAA